MNEVLLLGITFFNLGILAMNLKLYTEFVKQRMQEARRND